MEKALALPFHEIDFSDTAFRLFLISKVIIANKNEISKEIYFLTLEEVVHDQIAAEVIYETQ